MSTVSLGQIAKQIAESGLVAGERKKELVNGIAESWGGIMASLVVEMMEKRHLITVKRGRVYPKNACPYCHREFPTWEAVKRHMEKEGSPRRR